MVNFKQNDMKNIARKKRKENRQ